MPPDPELPSSKASPQLAAAPPRWTPSEPPVIGATPPLTAPSPPPLLPPTAGHKSSPARKALTILLSLCLAFFLADGLLSLIDASLILVFGIRALTILRGLVFLLATVLGIVTYLLMGLSPSVPKRLFLPIALFTPATSLLGIPFLIYFYSRFQQIDWLGSLCQVVLGLTILRVVHGGFRVRWPLVPEQRLPGLRFSWLNLSAFLGLNLFVLLPAVIAYLALCAALAVDRFSDGFLALRPGGLTVRVRQYVRADGKTVQLYPMSHVGNSAFYRKLSASFPADSIILMEGVTDNRDLLTNHISYKRMATSLGLAEQQKEFKPSRGKMVRADVDVEEFAPDTIDCLNLVMLVHSKGVNAETVLKLIQYSPPPDLERQLFDDLIHKRNRHLTDELDSRLSESDILVVPWGVAHMPGIAKEIRKSGFHLDKTQEYVAIRFGAARHKPE